jgi:hypothetical protein
MDENTRTLEALVSRLRNQIRVLSALFLVGLSAGSFLMLRRGDDRILRARGIIIVDDQGRDRILIGAPVPDSKSRVRTDPQKAMKAWGSKYPRFDWYAGLDHRTNGILILNDRGFDQIIVGDPVPDPNIGRRIAPSVGIAINDPTGEERSGWGFFPDKNRIVLGLDSDKGTEGVVLSILEDGSAGLSTSGGRGEIFLGHTGSATPVAGPPGPFDGLFISNREGASRKLEASDPKR